MKLEFESSSSIWENVRKFEEYIDRTKCASDN